MERESAPGEEPSASLQLPYRMFGFVSAPPPEARAFCQPVELNRPAELVYYYVQTPRLLRLAPHVLQGSPNSQPFSQPSQIQGRALQSTSQAFQQSSQIQGQTFQASPQTFLQNPQIQTQAVQSTSQTFHQSSQIQGQTLQLTSQACHQNPQIQAQAVQSASQAFQQSSLIQGQTLQLNAQTCHQNPQIQEQAIQSTFQAFQQNSQIQGQTLRLDSQASHQISQIQEQPVQSTSLAFQQSSQIQGQTLRLSSQPNHQNPQIQEQPVQSTSQAFQQSSQIQEQTYQLSSQACHPSPQIREPALQSSSQACQQDSRARGQTLQIFHLNPQALQQLVQQTPRVFVQGGDSIQPTPPDAPSNSRVLQSSLGAIEPGPGAFSPTPASPRAPRQSLRALRAAPRGRPQFRGAPRGARQATPAPRQRHPSIVQFRCGRRPPRPPPVEGSAQSYPILRSAVARPPLFLPSAGAAEARQPDGGGQSEPSEARVDLNDFAASVPNRIDENVGVLLQNRADLQPHVQLVRLASPICGKLAPQTPISEPSRGWRSPFSTDAPRLDGAPRAQRRDVGTQVVPSDLDPPPVPPKLEVRTEMRDGNGDEDDAETKNASGPSSGNASDSETFRQEGDATERKNELPAFERAEKPECAVVVPRTRRKPLAVWTIEEVFDFVNNFPEYLAERLLKHRDRDDCAKLTPNAIANFLLDHEVDGEVLTLLEDPKHLGTAFSMNYETSQELIQIFDELLPGRTERNGSHLRCD